MQPQHKHIRKFSSTSNNTVRTVTFHGYALHLTELQYSQLYVPLRNYLLFMFKLVKQEDLG